MTGVNIFKISIRNYLIYDFYIVTITEIRASNNYFLRKITVTIMKLFFKNYNETLILEKFSIYKNTIISFLIYYSY